MVVLLFLGDKRLKSKTLFKRFNILYNSKQQHEIIVSRQKLSMLK